MVSPWALDWEAWFWAETGRCPSQHTTGWMQEKLVVVSQQNCSTQDAPQMASLLKSVGTTRATLNGRGSFVFLEYTTPPPCEPTDSSSQSEWLQRIERQGSH